MSVSPLLHLVRSDGRYVASKHLIVRAVTSVRYQGRELGVFASEREAQEASLRHAPTGAEIIRANGDVTAETVLRCPSCKELREKRACGECGAPCEVVWLMVYRGPS